jgi:hypothetical protein
MWILCIRIRNTASETRKNENKTEVFLLFLCVSGVPAGEPVAAAHALPPGAQALRLQRVRRPVHHEEQLQATRRGACRPEVRYSWRMRIRIRGWPKSMRIWILLAKINADPDPAGQNQGGSRSGWPKSMRIRIRLAKVNADMDPAG